MGFQIVYAYLFLIFMEFLKSSAWNDNFDYQNYYGDGYGTEWIFFPDGDGIPHFVNLTMTEPYNSDTRRMSDEILFRLYTSNNTDRFIAFDENAKFMQDRYYAPITSDIILSDKPLKVITHGWKSSADRDGVQSIKNAYIETKTANVITVDWSTTADSIFYHWVANETKAIGARVASFLDKLVDEYGIEGDKVHLIGHSLGAHVMGIAASKTNITVNRVTGLDPARPLFEFPPQDDFARLDSTDAQFVDVIHTCGGLLGCESPIGTVDFYPNNGIAPQPGCEDIMKYLEACSHGRSFYYFAESIRHPKSFPAYQCQSWSEFLQNKCSHNGFMGEGVSRNMSGKFYLKTNAFSPFGLLTQNSLEIDND